MALADTGPSRPRRARTARPRTLRRLIVLVSALAVGASALTGCSTAKEMEARLNGAHAACPIAVDESIDTTVRIGWQTIPNGNLILQDRGLLEACMPNASIQWIQFDGGDDVVQAYGSGAIDIGISGSSAAVKAMSPPLSLPVQAIWIADVIGDSEALVSNNPEITTLADLKGRTVAVTFGATPHYSLLSMLAQEGLQDQVTVVNLTGDVMPAAWDRHEIDAAWTWEPTLSELMKRDGHVIMTSQQSADAGYPTFDIIAARRDFVAAEPEFMLQWTRLQDYAAQEIAQHPDQAAQSMAALLGTDEATVKTQMKGYVYLDARGEAAQEYFGGGLPDKLRSTAQFLGDVGMTDGADTPEHYRDSVYTDAVLEVGA